jgi:hypothetical protein
LSKYVVGWLRPPPPGGDPGGRDDECCKKLVGLLEREIRILEQIAKGKG